MTRSKYCPYCRTTLLLPSQYTNPIPQCPACGYIAFDAPLPVVLVLVYDGDKILLGRSPRHQPGTFALLAGHIDPGENAEEAAVREVKEESGVDCEITHFMGSYLLKSQNKLCLTFAAKYLGGIAKADDDVEEVRWFDRRDDIKILGSVAQAVVSKWSSGVRIPL